MNAQPMGASSSPTSTYHFVRGSPSSPPLAQELDAAAKDDGTILEQFHVSRSAAQADPGSVTLLERVDLLDDMLSSMEVKAPGERSSCSSMSPQIVVSLSSGSPPSLEKRCKPAESVLEEVEEKGTLVERVSELEKRVLKLQGIISTKYGDSVPVTLISLSDLEEAKGEPHFHSLGGRSSSKGEASFHTHDERSSSKEVHFHSQDERSSPSIVAIDKQESLAFVASDPKGQCHPCEEYAYWRKNKKVILYETSCPETESAAGKKRFKMRPTKIKKWLSKRLHMPIPGLAQVEAH